MRRTTVLVALLVLILSAFAVPTHAASASLAVSPSSIVQNETITLSLSGFSPKESISLWLTLPDYSVIPGGDLTAGDDGTVTKTLLMSTEMPVGAYSISARGNRSGLLASAKLQVRAAAGPAASSSIVLTVAQRSLPQGECFDFVGAGYNSLETIAVWLRSPDGSLSDDGLEREFPADSAGGFTYYICFGRLAQEGTYAFTARGKTSGLTGIVEFKLERGDYLAVPNNGAVLYVEPKVARQLETVDLVGGGFKPGEKVSLWITLPNGVVLSLISGITQDGTFAERLTLPPLPVGKHYISAYGETSGLRAVAALELLPGNGN